MSHSAVKDPDSEEEYTTFINRDNLKLSSSRNRLTLYSGLIFFTILPQCFDSNYDTSEHVLYTIVLWLALVQSIFSLIMIWKLPNNQSLLWVIPIVWVLIAILGCVSVILLSVESNDCSSADSFLKSYYADVLVSTGGKTKFECLSYFLGRHLIWISLAFVLGTDMYFQYGDHHIWRVFSQVLCISVGGWFELYFVVAFTAYPPLDEDFQWDITDTGYFLMLISAALIFLFYCLFPLLFKQKLQERCGWYTSSIRVTLDFVNGFLLLIIGASMTTGNPVLNIAVLNTQYIYVVLCVVVACEIFNVPE